jgi:hypothetical protein
MRESARPPIAANIGAPRKLARIGAVLLSVSGVVNAALGAQIGALFYEVYPGGRMGHVGVLAGAAAVIIGGVILLVVVPLYTRESRPKVLIAGALTVVLGHLGAVAGALYVGTVGVVLCYVAGIWAVVAAARTPQADPP